MKTLSTLLWIGVILASVLGGGFVLLAVFAASAPQQGATAAVACGIVIAPYAVARAVDAIRSKD